MANGVFVSYLRVSTDKQGRSGLGLEAQREAVAQYLNGGNWRLVAELVEVESGKRKDRPKLADALALCRAHRATLVVAKLDRLARNAAFLLNLRDAGVEFVACDMPDANRMTVGILAVVAEDESERISVRTKDALAAAKRRGVKLGGFRGSKITAEARALGQAAIAARSDARAADLAHILAMLRAQGVTSLGALAKELTARCIPTARGQATWTPMQVSRVLARTA